MTLSTKHTGAILLAILFMGTSALLAQTNESTELKKQKVFTLLKEKLHRDYNTKSPHGSIAAQKTTFAYDQRISTEPDTINEAEVAIAYNPGDSSKVVISYMRNPSGYDMTFPIYYSSDAGATWTQSSFGSQAILSTDTAGRQFIGGAQPSFAWDKNGRLYFSWFYLSADWAVDTVFFAITWAYSDDNGHTWSTRANHFIGRGAFVAASGTVLPYYDGITTSAWLAVDNSGGAHQGNVYCCLYCGPATGSDYLGVKTLVPGTDTFGSAVVAYTGYTECGNVAVDKNGVVHVGFADAGTRRIKHTLSTNAGASFATAVEVARTSIIFPNGPTYKVHNRENAAPNMAVDGAAGTGKNVHIVWSEFPSGKVISYYSRSSDSGATWSQPDTLNKYFSGKLALMPTVSAQGNNVAISIAAMTGTDSMWYYQLASIDGGATFTSPSLISTASTSYLALGANNDTSRLFFGDRNATTATACNIYTAWSDGRNTIPKVYFARTNFCTLGIKEITSVGDEVQLLSLYPNPASTEINLSVQSVSAQAITTKLYDMAGRQLAVNNYALHVGSQVLSMPVLHLPAGTYVVSLEGKSGVIATRVVVKG